MNYYTTVLAPNGLNMYGEPVRCYECDSLYHVQGYCPVQKSRLTKRDNEKMLKEIVNFDRNTLHKSENKNSSRRICIIQ